MKAVRHRRAVELAWTIVCAVVMATLIASCADDDIVINGEEEKGNISFLPDDAIQFYASVPSGATTRIAFGDMTDDGEPIYWTVGDSLWIFRYYPTTGSAPMDGAMYKTARDAASVTYGETYDEESNTNDSIITAITDGSPETNSSYMKLFPRSKTNYIKADLLSSQYTYAAIYPFEQVVGAGSFDYKNGMKTEYSFERTFVSIVDTMICDSSSISATHGNVFGFSSEDSVKQFYDRFVDSIANYFSVESNDIWNLLTIKQEDRIYNLAGYKCTGGDEVDKCLLPSQIENTTEIVGDGKTGAYRDVAGQYYYLCSPKEGFDVYICVYAVDETNTPIFDSSTEVDAFHIYFYSYWSNSYKRATTKGIMTELHLPQNQTSYYDHSAAMNPIITPKFRTDGDGNATLEPYMNNCILFGSSRKRYAYDSSGKDSVVLVMQPLTARFDVTITGPSAGGAAKDIVAVALSVKDTTDIYPVVGDTIHKKIAGQFYIDGSTTPASLSGYVDTNSSENYNAVLNCTFTKKPDGTSEYGYTYTPYSLEAGKTLSMSFFLIPNSGARELTNPVAKSPTRRSRANVMTRAHAVDLYEDFYEFRRVYLHELELTIYFEDGTFVRTAVAKDKTDAAYGKEVKQGHIYRFKTPMLNIDSTEWEHGTGGINWKNMLNDISGTAQ